MKNFTAMFIAGSLSMGTVGTALAEKDGGAFAAENFSTTLTMTSNYMYRGLSFSLDSAALQGSFDWAHGNFFAGVWASSLADQDSSGYELEHDIYVGYANSVAGIDWYIMPIYYNFTDFNTKNTAGADADVAEIWLDASYVINDTFSLHGMYAYSPDFFFESGDAHYVRGDVTAALPAGFSLTAGVGSQDVEGDNGDWVGADGWDYTHWDVSISKDLAGFNLNLMYSDTSEDSATDKLNTIFFTDTKQSDSEVVFTVSRSF